jgi:hypothetical protein
MHRFEQWPNRFTLPDHRGMVVAFGKNRKSRSITITRENGFDSSGATRQHLQAPGVNAGNPTFPIIPAPHVSPYHERLWHRGADFGGRTVARCRASSRWCVLPRGVVFDSGRDIRSRFVKLVAHFLYEEIGARCACSNLSAGTRDRSGDRPAGERTTNIEPGYESKAPQEFIRSWNPKDAKDFNCRLGSLWTGTARQFPKIGAYISVWRRVRAALSR